MYKLEPGEGVRVSQIVNLADDLSMALRNSSEEMKARAFKNMSSRAAQALKDDMNVAGPVRLRLVEEAQQRIINTVRALQEAEEIVVSRGDQDVLI